MHALRIPQDVLDRIAARRGKLHPFDRIEGPKTALVAIDLQNAFLLPGMPAAVKGADTAVASDTPSIYSRNCLAELS